MAIGMAWSVGCVQDVQQRPSVRADASEDAESDAQIDLTPDPCAEASAPPLLCTESDCAKYVLPSPVSSSAESISARFGASVAIHGDTLVVGAPGAQSVYVYQWNAESDEWELRHTISDEGARAWFPEDASPGEHFGSRVALNDKWLAIAEPDRTRALEASIYNETGHVYVGSTSSLGSSPLTAIKNPDFAFPQSFGSSIALSDSNLYIGFSRRNLINRDEFGEVRRYTLSEDSEIITASNTRTLPIEDVQFRRAFGAQLAVSGELVAVSSYAHDVDPGDGGEVVQDAGMVTLYGTDTVALTDEPPKTDALFGFSTAFGDGFFVSGSPSKKDQGVVGFFRHEGESLTPVNVFREGVQSLGFSVAAHGPLAVAGDPGADGKKGSVTLFSNILCEGQMSESTLKASEVFESSDPAIDLKEYGYAVAQSARWVVVGAPGSNRDQGVVHVIRMDDGVLGN